MDDSSGTSSSQLTTSLRPASILPETYDADCTSSKCELPENIGFRQLFERNHSLANVMVGECRELFHPLTSKLIGYTWGDTDRYISDVCISSNPGTLSRVYSYLSEYGTQHRGRLFIISREEDHIHIIHDCKYSRKCCDCRWTINKHIKETLSSRPRRPKFMHQLKETDYFNILIYFRMRKRILDCKIWLDGKIWRPQGSHQDLRWADVCRLKELLGRETSGDGSDLRHRSSDTSATGKSIRKRRSHPSTTGSDYGAFYKEVEKLLNELIIIPAHDFKFNIPRDHSMYSSDFWDPSCKTKYDSATQQWTCQFNHFMFNDFYNFYEGKLPLFFARGVNPFEFYMDIEESTDWIIKLLKFQFNDNDDIISKFLNDIKRWFNNEGMPLKVSDVDPNFKMNAILVYGPPSGGKSFFWDLFSTIAINIGNMSSVHNKTNSFPLQDIVNRRIIKCNEITYDNFQLEKFKCLFEGVDTDINVKYQRQGIFKRTPIIITCNIAPTFIHDKAFKDMRIQVFRFKAAPFLKPCIKKPYPLCLFNVYKKYNVSLE